MDPKSPPDADLLSPRFLAFSTAFCLGAMLLYAGILGHPPVWDDDVFVFGQPFLMDCRNLARVVSPRIFTGVLQEKNCARPVWLASVLLDTCAGDGAVPVYRLTSVYWHAMGALLVLILAWVLTSSWRAAGAAGLLFAVHPVHAEAVNIITYRSDLLCLAFMLGAMVLYRRGRPLFALLCTALALLSKEMAVVLPLQFLLMDAVFPRSRPTRRRREFLAASVLLVLAYLMFHGPRSGYRLEGTPDVFDDAINRVSLPFSPPLSRPPAPTFGAPEKPQRTPWSRIYSDRTTQFLSMSRVFGSYLRLLAWPNALQGDYSPKAVDSWRDPSVVAAWTAWLALLAAAWFFRGSVPLFSFGIGWTAVALLPVTGLIPLLNPQAERYVYVASAGWCMATAGLLFALFAEGGKRRVAACALLAASATAGAWRLVRRNRDFRDERSFYSATIAADPGVARAHLGLGLACLDAGDDACAEAEFRQTLRLFPQALAARFDLAELLNRRGRYTEESAELAKALQIAPRDPAVLDAVAVSDWRAGRRGEAAAALRTALQAAPDEPLTSELLGELLMDMGRDREAIANLRRTCWKSETALYALSVALRRIGRGAEAERYLAKLGRLNPRLAAMARTPHPKLYRPL
jgi:tetratricopeptide (TPR) repeat protein